MVRKDWATRVRLVTEGFTLLEVLIAMVVLCVGFFAMAGVGAGIMRSHALSGQVTAATVLAQEKMEAVLLQGYAFMTAQKETVEKVKGCSVPSAAFKRIVSVREVSGMSGYMKRVIVTVSWEDGTHAISLDTVVGE